MSTKLFTNNLDEYLQEDSIVDYRDAAITQLADTFWQEAHNETDYIKRVYEFVKDDISHSADINAEQLTCSASEVLNAGHGICFAKSHLLAALLRCKSIPAGFCYQKLILDDETAPVLIYHGLNGVYIKEYQKWIRLDARGNKEGVNARFSLEEEYLAFPVRLEKGEETNMSYYAVTLEFDKESEKKMQEMIEEVARVTGCDLMIQQQVSPHVTVCCLEGDNDEALLAEMEEIATSISKQTLRFANIGVFNPLVIYLGPIMNEFLWNTNRIVNERLLQYAEVGNKGNYLPNHWVPHVGIALKLTPDALNEAFDIVREKFTPFEAVVERILLVKAEPYEEMQAWELKD